MHYLLMSLLKTYPFFHFLPYYQIILVNISNRPEPNLCSVKDKGLGSTDSNSSWIKSRDHCFPQIMRCSFAITLIFILWFALNWNGADNYYLFVCISEIRWARCIFGRSVMPIPLNMFLLLFPLLLIYPLMLNLWPLFVFPLLPPEVLTWLHKVSF